ncbi:MAG: PKD domain-containing protein [Planctomycetota bacterium]
MACFTRFYRSFWIIIPALLLTGCVLPANSNEAAPAGSNPLDIILQSLINHAPVADAGTDQTVAAGETVRLDGTGSSDADSDRLRYLWVQISGTPTIDINQSVTSIVSFDAPTDITETTVLTFSLTVTDGFAATVDQIQITITATD